VPEAVVGTSAARDAPGGGQAAALAASHPFLIADCFRLALADLPAGEHAPAACAALRVTRRDGGVRFLYRPLAAAGDVAEHRLGAIPFFARVVDDATARAWLAATGTAWSAAEPVHDAGGRRVASVWRDVRGSVFLPFDPDEAVRNLWSEAYQSGGARTLARRAYYRVRPLLPRPLQIALRRAFTRVQERSEFPRWPLEGALHDLCDRVLALVAELAGEPIPYLAPWPAPYEWALVLTHDVETTAGVEHAHLLRDVELAAGCRSSWNFVPERYPVPDALIAELSGAGFEIGVHGLRHDGLDLDSRRRLRRRLPAMRAAAARWGAVGFRAPALHRRWEWMPELGFDYDSSYPDSDPYEPQHGGCCSWLPFFNRDLVELPVTLAQDHTMFVLLGRTDGELWSEKARALARRGGMALIITHPDYMIDPDRLGVYDEFVRTFAADPAAWNPLPREAAAWWRRRAASRPELVDGEWTVSGPAAGEARIVFAEGGDR
jgi:peptidoglycan/xylan/chitin deacetylase (PgdA/CDA1 family)